MRNLSMKKFGTPIGAAPGVASGTAGSRGSGCRRRARSRRGVSPPRTSLGAFESRRSHSEAVVEVESFTTPTTLPDFFAGFDFFFPSRQPWSRIVPVPDSGRAALPALAAVLGEVEAERAGRGVAVGVGARPTVSMGRGIGRGLRRRAEGRGRDGGRGRLRGRDVGRTRSASTSACRPGRWWWIALDRRGGGAGRARGRRGLRRILRDRHAAEHRGIEGGTAQGKEEDLLG